MDDELPSPFRISMKAALIEIAASIPSFWVVYQLSSSGGMALAVGIATMYGTRLWRKGYFGPPAKRIHDRHIPIISPGHALTWFNVFCLAGGGAVLDGGRAEPVIKDGLFLLFAMALVLAGNYAWRLYQERKT